MNPLQYTSEEMFSSTELIRKSKMVFDKLNNKDIEKAIILRDGKPSFMLLDFSEYEKLMHEYLDLKEFLENQDAKPKVENKATEKEQIVEEKKEIEGVKPNEVPVKKNEIDEKDLEEALAEIENLNLESIGKQKKITKESLNDFWEES